MVFGISVFSSLILYSHYATFLFSLLLFIISLYEIHQCKYVEHPLVSRFGGDREIIGSASILNGGVYAVNIKQAK